MTDIEDLKEERLEEVKNQQEQQEELEDEREQQTTQMAKEYLSSKAQSRLENVRAARPDQASSIEQRIVQLGMSGAVNEISDSKLKQLLKDLNQKGSDYSIKHR